MGNTNLNFGKREIAALEKLFWENKHQMNKVNTKLSNKYSLYPSLIKQITAYIFWNFNVLIK
jgi:hypothetical protein